MPQRPPFDDDDAETAQRYLRSQDLTAFDPFAAESAGDDVIFTTSLAVVRRMMEESFATATSAGRHFRGYPTFVERSSPNAFAVDFEGVQVCGVNVGLVVSLYEISLFVFSQAALFPEVGHAAGERSPSLPDGTALSFLMSDRLRADPNSSGEPIGADLVPQDGERQRAALFLMHLMVRFAWLHELYHGLNGHTGLMAERCRGLALNEMPDDLSMPMVDIEGGDLDPRWRLTLHCMEFDADRTALWAMMRMQEEDAEPIAGIAAMPKTLRKKLVLFAGIMMTFLFDQSASRHGAAVGGTHPLAYHRLQNLVRTIASNLVELEGVKAAFDEVLTEMTRLRNRVPELFSPGQLLHDLREPDLHEAFDQIERALADARDRFAPFAFHHEFAAREE